MRALLTSTVLLVFATSAAAECAWVLWDIETPAGPNAASVYTVDSAYDTRTACEAVGQDKAGRPWNRPEHALAGSCACPTPSTRAE